MEARDSKFEIHAAARDGALAKIEALLNANPKLATTLDDDGRLPIHWAVSYNHAPIVELLTQRKDFDPDVPDSLGWTPLMMASSRKVGDAVVALLLARGADADATNAAHQSALHFAASRGNLDVARALVGAGASARVKDRRGQYALHRAAAAGSVPVMRLLVERKSPLDAKDADGLTALHHALAEGHGDAAVVLLKSGADSGKRDGEGRLPIDMAFDAKVSWL
jgi:26S proteasome non-ATPase regulatory subunit 10